MAEGGTKGGMIALHSTVHPDTCRRLAERAAAKGVSLIDAPVSGGAPAVAEKRLLVMVGGEPDVVKRCRPVFETYADPVIHLGGLGSGQVAKLLNNLMFTANLANAKTTLQLGEALGVNTSSLCDVLTRGSASSSALNSIAAMGGSLDVISQIAGALLHKDVRLVVDIAEKGGASPGAVLDAADAALKLLGHQR
jgi:3-hydroxyisobutyrate dehydrogenase